MELGGGRSGLPGGALEVAPGGRGRHPTVGGPVAMLVLARVGAPAGERCPREYVDEQIRSRGDDSLGRPSHAPGGRLGRGRPVLGSRDADLLRQLGDVFDGAGLICERTADVAGVEMAGAAKNTLDSPLGRRALRAERGRRRRRADLAGMRRLRDDAGGPSRKPSPGWPGWET